MLIQVSARLSSKHLVAVLAVVAAGCTSGGDPITRPGSRIDKQIEFKLDPGSIANHSAAGTVPSVQYIGRFQIRNRGGEVTYRVTTTPIGPGGERYEDVEGRISPSKSLFGLATTSERVWDFNSVRARAVRYHVRVDVTFEDGSTEFVQGENVMVDGLPPRPVGLVISEVRLAGAAGAADQFVELYNGSSVPVDLRHFNLDTWNQSSEIPIRVSVRGFPSVTLAPGCYFLLTSSGRGGTAEGVGSDATLSHELALDGGLALRDPNGQVIDQVGFHPGSPFLEGAPLTSLSERRNRSYVRVGDTANNASDFAVRDPSEPQNLSYCQR